MLARIWTWISNITTAWGLLPVTVAAYLATTFWVGVMAVVGFVQSVPLFWIMLGLPLAAASFMTLFLRGSEWKERQSILNKIAFEAPRVLKKTKNGAIESIFLGFQLRNHASFPIDFELVSLDTSLADKYPPKMPYKKKRFTIPPHSVGWFDDHAILFTPAPQSNVSGSIHFKVGYGIGKKLKYDIEKKINVYAGFNESGDLVGSNWYESDI